MNNIILDNVAIDTLILNNNNDTTLVCPYNNTVVTNIISNLQSEKTLSIRTLFLQGYFDNSSISINNDCVIFSDDSFVCNTPISINGDKISVFLLGNYSNFTGVININNNVNFSINQDTLLGNNFDIIVKENSSLSLNGNYPNSTVILENNTTLEITGYIKTLVSTDPANIINLTLNNDTSSIKELNNISYINLSGDNVAINQFQTSHSNINSKILSSYYIIDFIMGNGKLSLPPINSSGNYNITISVIDDENEYIISNPINITIN